MALSFNEVLRPRLELLVIRQTRLEPTLMTVFGLAVMGLGGVYSFKPLQVFDLSYLFLSNSCRL